MQSNFIFCIFLQRNLALKVVSINGDKDENDKTNQYLLFDCIWGAFYNLLSYFL